jgi:hypothetical protein
VTGIDVAAEIVERARVRYPHVVFVAADFLATDLPLGGFVVVVSLETMAHIEDQVAFLNA